jgi:hypothetical protein
LREPWSVGKAMTISGGLEWLCAEPRQNFTLSALLRRGWPSFASVVLLSKQFELGRAARLVERVIFLGAMAGFIYYGGLPLGSLEKVGGLTDHIADEMIPRARGLI